MIVFVFFSSMKIVTVQIAMLNISWNRECHHCHISFQCKHLVQTTFKVYSQESVSQADHPKVRQVSHSQVHLRNPCKDSTGRGLTTSEFDETHERWDPPWLWNSRQSESSISGPTKRTNVPQPRMCIIHSFLRREVYDTLLPSKRSVWYTSVPSTHFQNRMWKTMVSIITQFEIIVDSSLEIAFVRCERTSE